MYGNPRHDVPDIRAASGRVHAHEDVMVAGDGILDAPELQHIGGTEPVLHDRFRGVSSRSGRSYRRVR